MKKLFALMALAVLAAIQIGCSGEEPKTSNTPPANRPTQGVGMPGEPADKKAGDKAAGDAAATDGDKAPEGDAAPGDEKDKEEAPKE